MQVLAVTPEVYPLVKTGGLADVAGALPRALARQGVATRTLVPGYAAVRKSLRRPRTLHRWDGLQGGSAALLQAEVDGLNLLILDAPHLFDRSGGPYADSTGVDWPDNWRRFAALAQAAADLAAGGVPGYAPDIVHAHDWQSAMALAYMRYGQAAGVPSVMTIHNLAFQGRFGAGIFAELGLPAAAMSLDGVEYYGGIGFLKAGLQAAWAITTVSPTYAQEIRTAEFGMGLDGLLTARARDLHGIVNGIDVETWNPETDPHLAATYSRKSLKARRLNAQAVEERFGLGTGPGPLLCVVSRLTWQKGMDILAATLDAVVGAGARLAILGTGDAALEGALLAGAARHRGRAGVVIGYDEKLAHLLQGGADAILVPSRFEPCGLTQLIGLRYGCVPVVARTGGLADTVIDANEAALSAGVATGFQFAAGDAGPFLHGLGRMLEAYADKATWTSIKRQGMRSDVSWDRSAAKYVALYRSLISRRTG